MFAFRWIVAIVAVVGLAWLWISTVLNINAAADTLALGQAVASGAVALFATYFIANLLLRIQR